MRHFGGKLNSAGQRGAKRPARWRKPRPLVYTVRCCEERKAHPVKLRNRPLTILLSLLLAALLLAACGKELPGGAPRGQTVEIEKLPAGVGRGFPVAYADAEGAEARTGEPAPDFRLVLEDGRGVSLSDLKGRPVLINFWATWCAPCRREMPAILAAAAAEPDLVVLAVNVQETLERIQPFSEEFGMEVPVVQDPEGVLYSRYRVRGMPTTYFVDRQGTLDTIALGAVTSSKLDEVLAPLLGE